MGSDLGVSHCQAGDESVCDHVCDFQWIRFDCVGRRVIENTEWKRIVSLKS